ncbi:MAG: fibronectin type III-like domain-contianing protein, partial [Candidatus Helarchaeota archaeon]|nr:fibronectin type III-like domain-contianing protein [Candidatus Helarchaeota archaeon]
QISPGDKISISLNLTNSGERTGAEVVQLYVQDVKSSVERPLKELKGFQKVALKPGEKKSLTFELSEQDLAFYDENKHTWRAEAGTFKILIGSSSRDIR